MVTLTVDFINVLPEFQRLIDKRLRKTQFYYNKIKYGPGTLKINPILSENIRNKDSETSLVIVTYDEYDEELILEYQDDIRSHFEGLSEYFKFRFVPAIASDVEYPENGLFAKLHGLQRTSKKAASEQDYSDYPPVDFVEQQADKAKAARRTAEYQPIS